MKNAKYNIDIFHKTIENKLVDSDWDQFIAEKVICTKKERSRKNFQLRIMQGILVTTITLVYMGAGRTHKSPQQVKLEPKRKNVPERMLSDFGNTNLKTQLIYTVFNRLE